MRNRLLSNLVLPLVAGTVFLGTLPLRAADDAVKIVTLGDSITRGVRAGVKTEETFAALLEADLRKKKIAAEVVNVGIGGERTDRALARLAKSVVALKPQVVTIMYGTNDSHVDRGTKEPRLSVDKYRGNLKSLVQQLRKHGIAPVVMTPPRWGEKARDGLNENPNVRLEAFVKACREVAREMKVPLVDHFAHWSNAEKGGTDIGAWTTDQCHPNPRGHREMSDLIGPVVVEVLAKNKQ
jgi:acyl-CoA thioesterase-1